MRKKIITPTTALLSSDFLGGKALLDDRIKRFGSQRLRFLLFRARSAHLDRLRLSNTGMEQCCDAMECPQIGRAFLLELVARLKSHLSDSASEQNKDFVLTIFKYLLS